ncbi:peptidoglycan recognition family protein [Streptomyces sp. CRN 30]|uniref:peptidoglycan recognition protein family protein n=1 Tax=Streptomyces sp. CRN 30 TaxID=3075613 RepID=UPI002A833DC3|nr:peptidoglycan recognition family protein [Streptomyces sp. CRN 30]
MTVPPATPAHRAQSPVTRRTLIGTAGAVAAGAVITPAVMAGPAEPDTAMAGATRAGLTTGIFPETRAAAAVGEAPVAAAFPIGFVGVRWEGAPEATGGGIRLRTADGTEGAWRAFPEDGCFPASGGGLLIPADEAAGYELRAPAGATGLRSLALDTRRGPRRAVAVPKETTRMRGLAYVSRAAWGADESLRYASDGSENTPAAYYPFQTLTVHHTATSNDDSDPAATVRGIYQLHTETNGWGDIGYHFLIDEEGRIYEGRHTDDGGLPGHDGDGRVVTAFHVGGCNSGNLGIALMGTLTKRRPTKAARKSLTRLARVLVRQHGVDPYARVRYVNPVNGAHKEVPEISGHRDWMVTKCPGGTMYRELDRLREAVADGL